MLFIGCRYSPGVLVPYKWESAFTIQKTSWGYDRTVSHCHFCIVDVCVFLLSVLSIRDCSMVQ